ncbi:hypothetical protein WN944_021084 [Citrus x changshan-huyou]|uniref:Transcription repressor OFP7 n=2 Tax=Citrus TaxID=2706 RepID=A0ACB8J1S2_CITSI|nr:transcription repressor OFP7 [Citrus sinensis]
MGKRFKFQITRVIPSFNICRSKVPSALPSNPVPLFLRFSPVKPHPITLRYPLQRPVPSPKPKPPRPHSSIKGHVSSAITSFACGCRSRSSTECLSLSETDHTESPPTPEFHWEKEDKFHVVAKIFDEYESPRLKIYNSSASGGHTSCDDEVLLPSPPPRMAEKKKRRDRKKKRTAPAKTRMSTSSGVGSELSSSEGYDVDNEEETETLVSSSRSLSADDSSSEFNPQLETIREATVQTPFRRAVDKRKKKMKKRQKRCVLKTSRENINANNGRGTSSLTLSNSDPEIDTPARLSLFLKRLMPCALEGKVRDSFAVVKKSEDPYEDFKGSMLEMILEKEMFEDKDLEQLLQCFLSLNSRQHHGAIVKAFSEIWDALFIRRSTSFRVSTSQ